MITKIDKDLELNESLVEDNHYEEVNESVQIGDAVRLDGEKGFVIGQIDGKIIVQIQGDTKYVNPNKVKENKKPDITTEPHMKFDDKTQKLLFEQLIRCGIYMGNIPVKLTECYVKYSEWASASAEQPIKVMVEGNSAFMNKSQIKLFEDINVFANPDNYVSGFIINEQTDELLENVLINISDFERAIGDADPVRIIRETDNGQELQPYPKSSIQTLSE